MPCRAAVTQHHLSLKSRLEPACRALLKVKPGAVTTTWRASKYGAGPSCTLGRTWADVAMGRAAAASPAQMCSSY